MKRIIKRSGIAMTVLTAIIGGILWGFLNKNSPRDTVTSYTGREVEIENLTFYLRGDRIAGTVYRPSGDSTLRIPAVIYCPGLGENRDKGLTVCKGAAGKGYVGYAFDFRGGSRTSASTGLLPTEMTLSSEVEDLKAVIKGVKALRYVDKKNIFLVGEGFGGVVVADLVSQRPDLCRGIVLISPDLNESDHLNSLFPRKKDIPDTLVVGNTVIGRDFIKELRNTDTKSLLHGYSREYLILDAETGLNLVFKINDFIGEILSD